MFQYYYFRVLVRWYHGGPSKTCTKSSNIFFFYKNIFERRRKINYLINILNILLFNAPHQMLLYHLYFLKERSERSRSGQEEEAKEYRRGEVAWGRGRFPGWERSSKDDHCKAQVAGSKTRKFDGERTGLCLVDRKLT